jgi:molybdopterin molybdotransferase
VAAGVSPVDEVVPGTAVRIMTGAPMPAGADAVVPVELTRGSESEVTFRAPARPGAHVRHPGEDLTVGQSLVAAGHRLTPADVGLLASAGVALVRCFAAPRVVIVSSGDELVPSDTTPGPGQIRDANGPMLAAMVRAADAVPFSVGIVPDDHRALRNALDTNLGHADLILCSGGASAGTRDLLPEVIGELGEVASVKVAMRPGMPQIRGRIRGVPVIGLPGNPVSAFVSFEVFVRPAIRRLQRRRTLERPTVWARITEPLTSPPNKRGYIRVRLSRDAGGWVATPTGPQGSHLVTSIARASGLAIVPEEVVEVPADAEVSVQLLVDG